MASKTFGNDLRASMPAPASARPPKPRRHAWALLAVLAVALFVTVTNHDQIRRLHASSCGHLSSSDADGLPEAEALPVCPAQIRISPEARPDITDANVKRLFKSDSFRNLTAQRLSGAVQVPTQTFQNMGPLGEDPRWDAFYDFQRYLAKTFPLLHEKLDLEVVNEHGLLYTWQGSDDSLKPLLLMAHQDTVPVAEDTLSQWVHPPFSGYFDGTYVHGRGSGDCKAVLTAILSSVTALLEQDFTPHRTVILSFGFDEETGQYGYGAAALSRRIFEKWGPDSIALIVDEGLGIEEQFGRSFALPLASEKGYFDLEITVHVPGGHSSLPPSHTSIGILAEAVTRLESLADTNFPFNLEPFSPFNTFLQCAAEDESTDMPRELRDAIKDPKGRPLVLDYITTDPIVASILRTTQAVTIFQGGNKANALPAYAYALVNYRIASSETLDEVRRKIIDTLGPVANQFDLEFTWGSQADDSDIEEEAEVPEFTMALSWRKTSLEPSPVSPADSPSWHCLSGVIKHVFDEPDEEVIVAPFYAVGNTDTRFYWDLSPQIYRFGAMRSRYDTNMGNIHDVNERVSLQGNLEGIVFYHELIRVFDEADLDSL